MPNFRGTCPPRSPATQVASDSAGREPISHHKLGSDALDKTLVTTEEISSDQLPAFKLIFEHAVKWMIQQDKDASLSSPFWTCLLHTFWPVLEVPTLSEVLVRHLHNLLYRLHKEKALTENTLNQLKKSAQSLGDEALVIWIGQCLQRSVECAKFLVEVCEAKKSKKAIAKIKTELDLAMHIALIADGVQLGVNYGEFALVEHLHRLLQAEICRQLLFLGSLVDRECFACLCHRCRDEVLHKLLPMMLGKLAVSVISVPVKSVSSTVHQTDTVRTQDNPFDILSVSPSDDKSTVLQQVMLLSRQAPEKMPVFRHAQSELFDMTKHFLHRYFRYLSSTDVNVISLKAEMDIKEVSKKIRFNEALLI